MKKLLIQSVTFIFLLFASQAQAGIVTINFDSMTPGVYPTDFLSSYGIPNMTIGGTGPGADGPIIYNVNTLGQGNLAPSTPNVFMQHATSNDAYQTHSLTMQFLPELTAFSLTRMGATISSTPAWTATFYDSHGGLLGSFGEPVWRNTPSIQVFTFTAASGGTIAKMTLESIWREDASWSTIPVDNFVLTSASPVPIPAAVWLLGSGLLGLIGVRRKFKQ